MPLKDEPPRSVGVQNGIQIIKIKKEERLVEGKTLANLSQKFYLELALDEIWFTFRKQLLPRIVNVNCYTAGPDPGAPSGDLQATVWAGPHLRSGAKGEANAPEDSPGGVRTAELRVQVGSGRSVSAAAGAWGDAGRPGQAAPQAGSSAPRWSPSSET